MLGCGGCLGKGRKKYVSYEDLLDHRMANTPSMDYRRSCQRWARALTGPPRGWAPISFSDAPFPNPLSFARSVHDRSGHLHTGKGGFDRDADLHMLISTIVCVCVCTSQHHGEQSRCMHRRKVIPFSPVLQCSCTRVTFTVCFTREHDSGLLAYKDE